MSVYVKRRPRRCFVVSGTQCRIVNGRSVGSKGVNVDMIEHKQHPVGGGGGHNYKISLIKLRWRESVKYLRSYASLKCCVGEIGKKDR